jgi:hypothetical protein
MTLAGAIHRAAATNRDDHVAVALAKHVDRGFDRFQHRFRSNVGEQFCAHLGGPER